MLVALVAAAFVSSASEAAVPPPDAPDPALAFSVRDVEAETEAVLGFDTAGTGFFAPIVAAELLIRRGGTAIFSDQPAGVVSTTSFLPHPRVDVTDVDGDGDQDVIVDTYTRGEDYCCFGSIVFLWDGATYRRLSHAWLDAGYELRQDRGPLFRSHDAGFAGMFRPYLESAFPVPYPVQLWRVRGNRFVDVTREERARVEADMRLRRWGYRNAIRRVTRGERFSARGYFAAYLADLYLLGKPAAAARAIDYAVRTGVLVERQRPSVDRYLHDLRRALREFGYTR